MNDTEKLRTLESLLTLEHSLGRSIAALKTYRDMFANYQETLSLNVQIPNLEAELAKVRANEIAYFANANQFTPPSPDQAALIKAKSQELDALTLQAGAADSILQLAAAGLKAWHDSNAA
jgi:hypothetical protein